MKKPVLAVLTLVPVLSGYLVNSALADFSIGNLLFRLIPWVTLVFWFYLGKKYASSGWSLVKSLLISHAVGVVSLLLYVWQFLLTEERNRNLFWAGLSQLFTVSTDFLTARFAILFEPVKNTIGSVTVTAMQVLGLLLMALIFTAGFLYGKRAVRRTVE